MNLLLLLLALLGHGFLWVAAINRIHGTGLKRVVVRWLTIVCFFCLFALPPAFAWWFYETGLTVVDNFRAQPVPSLSTAAALGYMGLCWIGGAVIIPHWMRRHVLHRPPEVLRFHRTRQLPLEAPGTLHPEEHPHHLLVRMPGNQSLRLDLTERAIEVPRLPPALDGLSIVHLADFHFTGRVGKSYFQEIVRLSNELQPDLVTITGDLVDKSRYIDWIPDTLGRFQSRHGVYFVLGNHDRRVDTKRLLRSLDHCGLIHLGGRWVQVEVRGQPIVLMGNELPWFLPEPDLRRCPPAADGGPLRIVLAHTPDQFDWARWQDADLMLAGHTHGGQIRLPLIGPIFAPSRSGVRYASGLFHTPPTILHVTRGVSGQLPLRVNCPPEIAHLVLHSPNPSPAPSGTGPPTT